MKHTVDIETWERRDNYAFFRNFLNSWISVATEIDCTEARAAAKAAGRSFFLYYLYAVRSEDTRLNSSHDRQSRMPSSA